MRREEKIGCNHFEDVGDGRRRICQHGLLVGSLSSGSACGAQESCVKIRDLQKG